MPQMSPTWWLYLMLMFNILYLTMMCILYFNFKIKMNKKTKIFNKMFNWKW
uniref:ATP synthase F0 subunit 8 n=1 Tax=Jogocerus viraktamathi TaxID=3111112 RepID=UPI002E7A92BC|nr:ATP synthase F0 subunit 8 [Jogocerus viraktamathi]WRK19229.1 ATP synthase F0 subunit 8 [Jogocerus viraktamathi]